MKKQESVDDAYSKHLVECFKTERQSGQKHNVDSPE
jgi:hypothetical protein